MKRLALVLALILAPALAWAQAGYLSYGSVSGPQPAYPSGTNQPISLDLGGNLRMNCVAGCSGSTGAVQGFVTTTNPAYSPGAAAALSLTPGGNLRTRDFADGSAVPGTAVQNALLTAAMYNSSPITLLTGQQAALQADLNGYLNVHIQAGGASGGTSSTFASTFPSIGTALGLKNGANMVNGTADGSGNLDVNCMVGCPSLAGLNNADNLSAVSSGLGGAQAFNYIWNGSGWDRLRGSGGIANVSVVNAIPAGTQVIGSIQGLMGYGSYTPTITATSYSAGYCVGRVVVYPIGRSGSPGTGLILSVLITDTSGQNAPLDLVLFSAPTLVGTYTDHAACNISPSDMPYMVGVAHVTDCSALGTGGGSCQALFPGGLPYNRNFFGVDLIYGVLINRGTPTYTATNNLSVTIEARLD